MTYFNKVILVGRITRDPDARYTTSGKMVTSFHLAVNRPPRTDMENEVTDFIRIVSFGKLADFAKTYLRKGQLILVVGELRMQKWQAKDGTNRTTAEIWASEIRFMEKKAATEPYLDDFREETVTSESESSTEDETTLDEAWQDDENPDEPPF